MAEQLKLELMADDSLAGFRLQRLEIFNWGTFDGRVWKLEPKGKNGLLTGDIGSGKSTLVDAVTTLLVPSQRIAYNKAAGAGNKERSLRSYVMGYYKSERQDSLASSRPVALRDVNSNSYSVIMGVFHNAGYNKTITLAQVFWMKNGSGQPDRLYAACEQDMSIADDFSRFGREITGLRKKLRSQGVQVFNSFPPYGAWFRRQLGINNEQALELFLQTVSLKSVGNLTDFVRSHMLEPFDVQPRIQALIEHFENLDQAHEAVLKAKRQLEMLSPLVGDCNRHQELEQTINGLHTCRDALRPWFAAIKLELLEKRLATLNEDFKRYNVNIENLEKQRIELQEQERELRRSIADNGGNRLENIKKEIAQNQRKLERRKKRADRYADRIKDLGEQAATNQEDFLVQQAQIAQWRKKNEDNEAELQNKLTEINVELEGKRSEYKKLQTEIKSLKARVSNIGTKQIAMRHKLCQALEISEQKMPFAGELLQIRENERDWEGAAERMLHSFGLSLLVPDEYYPQVARWVDNNHLQGRLVYYRVRKSQPDNLSSLHQDSLASKLQIKPDSPFYNWLEYEIFQRFNLACCSSQEQFRREPKAITRAGQIKMPGGRHEKDDRYRIDDRSYYVLGWSNVDKIAALQKKADLQKSHIDQLSAALSQLQKERKNIQTRLSIISRLDEYTDFYDQDWQPVALDIDKLEQEKHDLESSSNILQTLNQRLKELEKQLRKTEDQLKQKNKKCAQIELKIDNTSKQQKQTQDQLTTEEELIQSFPILESIYAENFGSQTVTVESSDKRERDIRDQLNGRIGTENQKIRRLDEKIIRAMTEYKKEWPLETRDVDVNLGAHYEYRSMLAQLQADDLPRFEKRFKELLNENTIREVANFQSQLARERETIKDRIDQINNSLTKIDYNPARYISLEAQPNSDADIREFQAELRACTEGALTGSEDSQYSESKFLQVKNIINRFQGREECTDLDRRWTQKVTDVRNWFTFAASERWREDDTEHEHYTDSGGKSGGQKEKLAYTVLAASLAYQFGLEWGAVRSRSFRFVVIDEAFGRGSDESAQYGLQLFKQLNLQLMIVTPLQKIHIIEPFVANVGFIHNENDRSVLRNLSITEYRDRKERQDEVDISN